MSEESSFFLPTTFGGLEPSENTASKSKITILPIPLEKTTSYSRGTEYGPRAILEASKNMELYDEELDCDPSKLGIHTDLSLMNSGFTLLNITESIDIIEKHTMNLLGKDKFLVFLGGEHSLTTAIVNAYTKFYKKDFTVLQLDAHADLRDSYENESLSHACVMRRLIDKQNIVQVGIRSLSSEEASFIKSKKIKPFYAKGVLDNAYLNSVLKAIKTKDVYITFDLDFLDPSIMPAVGTPEPGGYGWYDSLKILKEVFKKKNVIGIDFNELSPLGDKTIYPDFLASKLVYKALVYKFFLKK